MGNTKKTSLWEKWIYWFIFSVAVIVLYKALDNFTGVTVWFSNLLNVVAPFLIGILIAGLLYIPAKKFEILYKKPNNKFLNKIARGLSVLTTYILVILLIIMAIKFIIPAITKSVTELIDNLPEYYKEATKLVNSIPENNMINKEELKDAIKNMQEFDWKKYLNFESITNYVKGVLSIASGIFDFFVAVIVSIYFLLERDLILTFSKKALRAIVKNDEKYNLICKYCATSRDVFFKFLGGQIFDAVIVGIITSIAMVIMKVEYAGLLGFMIGLFNLIPYFGAIVACIIAILVTVFTGGIFKAIWLAAVIILLQQIDANIINPRIIGASLKVSPILVIFAVTVGGAYFNVLGMFLGVPIVAVIKIILVDYVDYKNKLYEEEKIKEMDKPKRKTSTRIKKVVIGEDESL